MSREAASHGHEGKGALMGDQEPTVYGDLAWFGAGLALTASAFALTGSAAVQAVVMLGYIAAGAAIGARRRSRDMGARGRGDSWRQILCLVLAGIMVYLASRYVVRLTLGPWFTWWLAIGSGIVIFRRWQSLRAR